LRDRKEDIHLLFRKFAADFAHKYKMPLKLDDSAVQVLQKISLSEIFDNWCNVAEQLSVLETSREITATTTILFTH
jgi:DNA-binding NtrC family response regulator